MYLHSIRTSLRVVYEISEGLACVYQCYTRIGGRFPDEMEIRDTGHIYRTWWQIHNFHRPCMSEI